MSLKQRLALTKQNAKATAIIGQFNHTVVRDDASEIESVNQDIVMTDNIESESEEIINLADVEPLDDKGFNWTII